MCVPGKPSREDRRAPAQRGYAAMDLITVRIFDSRAEAERVQDFLTSRGIISYVMVDDRGGFGPFLGFTTAGYRLQIHRDDCERARLLLQEFIE